VGKAARNYLVVQGLKVISILTSFSINFNWCSSLCLA